MLSDDIVDERVAREALADVKACVGAARSVRVVDLAVDRIEGIDAVVAVADRRNVRGPVANRRREEHSVAGVVLRGQVFDDDPLGSKDANTIVEFKLTIEHHASAVGATDRDLVGDNVDGFVIRAGRDEHKVTWCRCIDRLLDCAELFRHPKHTIGAGGRSRFDGCVGRDRGVGLRWCISLDGSIGHGRRLSFGSRCTYSRRWRCVIASTRGKNDYSG